MNDFSNNKVFIIYHLLIIKIYHLRRVHFWRLQVKKILKKISMSVFSFLVGVSVCDAATLKLAGVTTAGGLELTQHVAADSADVTTRTMIVPDKAAAVFAGGATVQTAGGLIFNGSIGHIHFSDTGTVHNLIATKNMKIYVHGTQAAQTLTVSNLILCAGVTSVDIYASDTSTAVVALTSGQIYQAERINKDPDRISPTDSGTLAETVNTVAYTLKHKIRVD